MDSNKKLIKVLVIVIVVLVLFIAYAFAIRPALSNYVINKQVSAYNQAQTDLLNNILVQMQQNNGRADLNVGNYTLVLSGQLIENTAK